MNSRWQEKLSAGKIVIIDGGTGTELQRRGVPMDTVAWSGAAVLSHPEEVQSVHEDYIRAGAEVIITNTFGSTRQMMEPAGYGEHVETANRQGVSLAIQARDNVADRSVAVAGSISAMPPSFDRKAYFSPNKELESYREAAGYLADSGVDLIALEMMEDTVHSARAMKAAIETGLPVWLGLSCKQTPERELVSFAHEDIIFEEVLDVLVPMKPTVVNIMHTSVNAISDAINLVRDQWSGPLGVYPESGYFTKPNWNFVDVISPEDLVRRATKWVESGVQILGGCCGTGPQHIKALKDAFSD